MATVTQKREHASEFTAIEEVTLALWFDLDAQDLEDLAAEVLRKGLDWEHFTSLLDSDPALRSPSEMVETERLGLHAQEAFARGRNALTDSKKEKEQHKTKWLWDPEFGVWRKVVA